MVKLFAVFASGALANALATAFVSPAARPSVRSRWDGAVCTSRGGSICTARGRAAGARMVAKDEDDEVREKLEDEIRDNTGAISYVFPRPVRKVVWGAFGANSFWGALVLWTRYAAEGDEADLSNVIGNLETAAVLAALLAFEFWDEGKRKSFRKNLTSRQVAIGDREVYKKVDESTGKVRKFSKLKPVDDDWILRRIDRWGVVETATTGGNPLPTVGPAKGKILEDMVAEHAPKLIVDVGSFVGYAAIRMGRRQPEGALTVTIEKDFRWWASASRFVWQAKLWQQYPWDSESNRRVKCLLGDALALMPTVAKEYGAADMIFIDGKPSEYLQYLQVAEACGLVRPGTRVIADNAQVFASFKGVKEYLEYVRTSGKYESETIMSTLEYRDDTPDALEISRGPEDGEDEEEVMEGTSAVLKAVKSRTQNTFQDKKFIAVTNRRLDCRIAVTTPRGEARLETKYATNAKVSTPLKKTIPRV